MPTQKGGTPADPPADAPSVLYEQSTNQISIPEGAPGKTVAELLVGSHPGCPWHSQQTLDRFRRSGSRRFGLWIDAVLDAHPEDVDPDDQRFLSVCWSEWCLGQNPFTGRSRRVGL